MEHDASLPVPALAVPHLVTCASGAAPDGSVSFLIVDAWNKPLSRLKLTVPGP